MLLHVLHDLQHSLLFHFLHGLWIFLRVSPLVASPACFSFLRSIRKAEPHSRLILRRGILLRARGKFYFIPRLSTRTPFRVVTPILPPHTEIRLLYIRITYLPVILYKTSLKTSAASSKNSRVGTHLCKLRDTPVAHFGRCTW